MTENKRPRFTFRMSPEMFEKVKASAFKRNISMNAEISRILYLYFKDEIKQKEKQSAGVKQEFDSPYSNSSFDMLRKNKKHININPNKTY